jgi:lysophospholipase L1-like esterase
MKTRRGRRLDTFDAADEARAANYFRGLAPVASRCRGSMGTSPSVSGVYQSDGTLTSQTSRIAHRILAASCDIRVSYANLFNGNSAPDVGTPAVPTPNAINVAGGVQVGSATFQCSFGGDLSKRIAPGQYIFSDPIGVDLAFAATIYSRNFVSVDTLGQRWGTAVNLSGSGDMRWDGVDRSALTTTDGVTTPAYVYGPAAILAYVRDSPDPILIYGDSIPSGYGDTTAEPSAGVDPGWVTRKFNNSRPYLNMAVYGDRLSSLATTRRASRAKLMGACPIALCTYGVNDIFAGQTQAQVQVNMLAEWKAFRARDVRVYQTTITPKTTGPWTAVNTQAHANETYEAARVAVNTWLRDGAPIDASEAPVAAGTNAAGTVRLASGNHPLKGMVETADVVESARNSGFWKPSYTADGVHPTATTHQIMADQVDTSMVV